MPVWIADELAGACLAASEVRTDCLIIRRLSALVAEAVFAGRRAVCVCVCLLSNATRYASPGSLGSLTCY